MIINHEHPAYIKKRDAIGAGKYNGAYYYSKEITDNIIPEIKTDRNWILVNVEGLGVDHAIVFVHNNLHPENYEWLKQYKDLVIICGVPETVDKVKHLGKAIYLPLSIDTEYIEKFKSEKKSGAAYFGRRQKAKGIIPQGVKIVSGVPRDELLKRMARTADVYAIGRTAIEAKALGCNIKAFDPRFPDTSFWKVIDNKEAAKMLQAELDKIDNPVTVSAKSTKAELIAFAQDQGLDVNTKMTKAELMEVIGL